MNQSEYDRLMRERESELLDPSSPAMMRTHNEVMDVLDGLPNGTHQARFDARLIKLESEAWEIQRRKREALPWYRRLFNIPPT